MVVLIGVQYMTTNFAAGLRIASCTAPEELFLEELILEFCLTTCTQVL